MATKKKNPAAVALGRKGGKARVAKLSKAALSKQMQAIAKRPRKKATPKKESPK